MNDFITQASVIALLYAFVGLVRRALSGDWKNARWQGVAWLGGVVLAWIVSMSSFAAGFVYGPVKLSDAVIADVVLIGLTWGSMAMVGKDILKSVDASQSAAEPDPAPRQPSN